MKRLARFALLLSFSLIVACKSTPECVPQKSDAPKITPYKIGDIIADFTLADSDNKARISFDKDIKSKSKVIILTFFTATCSSCKEEMEFLSGLGKKHGDQIKIYAIEEIFAASKKNPAPNKPLIESITYLKDNNFALMVRFGFTFAPSLVVADGSGRITLLKGGYSATDNPLITKAIMDTMGK